MKESKTDELVARADYAKWEPVRRHKRNFSSKGKEFSGTSLTLYARVFARDLFQFGVTKASDLPEQEVAFVLSLEGSDKSSAIYNSMAQRLGVYVESAVVDQEIEIQN